MKGTIPLDSYCACELITDSKKQFKIYNPNKSDAKVITLSAPKQSIAKEWVNAIKLSIEVS